MKLSSKSSTKNSSFNLNKSFKIGLIIGSLFLSNSMFARTDLHCPNSCKTDPNCNLSGDDSSGYVCNWPHLSLSGHGKPHPYTAVCDQIYHENNYEHGYAFVNINMTLKCSSNSLDFFDIQTASVLWNSDRTAIRKVSGFQFSITNYASGHRHLNAVIDCKFYNEQQHHVYHSGCSSWSDPSVSYATSLFNIEQ